MLQSLRLFSAIASAFIDLTIKNQEHGAFFEPNLSSENYLYLSQTNPFNNFFMWSKAPNVQPSVLKIEYWSRGAWKPMADIIDATSVNEVTLAKSGVIYFSPDPADQWDEIEDSTKIEELKKAKIYNSYWLRISTDNEIGSECQLKEVSYCFANSNDIDGIDSEVKQYMDNIEDGKTDWTKELIIASKEVVKDLKRHNVIKDRGQLLYIEDVSTATIYRALMIIYNHLGRSFLDKMAIAQKSYEKSLSFRSFTIDKNKNARVDEYEQGQRQNRLIR